MDEHLPYRVEYTKNSKSSCRICEDYISADVLRISTVVKVNIHNITKLDHHWHHEECFFKKYLPATRREIDNFDNIYPNDQKRLKDIINEKRAATTSATSSTGNENNARKRRSTDAFPIAKFKAEYAKLDYLACHDCGSLIHLGKIRLSKKDHEDDVDHCYHLKCFSRLRMQLQFFDEGINIPGVSRLSEKDQDIVRMELPKIGDENIPPEVKRNKPEPEDDKHEKDLDNQQEKLFSIKKNLQGVPSLVLTKMLKENGQNVPKSPNKICDTVSDAMMSGAPESCSKCGGQFTFKSDGKGYRCNNAFPWASCGNVELYPKRKEFVVNENLKESYNFFENYKSQVKNRLLSIPPTESKKKLRLKGGGTVIPTSGLVDMWHVYQLGKVKFTTTLVEVHTQTKTNNFYNMQVLEHDELEKYCLFREWGRIGTEIPYKLTNEMSLDESIRTFEILFEEKTGHQWRGHAPYAKKHGMYYSIYDNYDDEDQKLVSKLRWETESKLKRPVQDLIRLIFGGELMKKSTFEYEIDTDQMPLGKIPNERIQQAHSVLIELNKLILNNSQDRTTIIEASNKFYTLIPHNFGIDGPNNIETTAEIMKKVEMLESLRKMNINYILVQNDEDANENPLDVRYEQLKTNIDVLDRESDEFKLIDKYVMNTHSKKHGRDKITVKEVFTVNRIGEESRFEKFKKLGNRKLLFHGSDVTNFAQILSQGLKTAPPGAPVTGHRFGKGIYFADMVSNAAYFCRNLKNSTGLLLLCDVALGNMYEQFKGNVIEELPENYDSSWVRGKTQPNPQESIRLETGLEVPCGPEISAETKIKFSPNHNQFVIHNEAQVKLEYIVQLKFEKVLRNN